MTAYELAEGLSKHYISYDVDGLFNKRIQNMLREQADRIAELEKGMDEAKTVIENLMFSVSLLKTQTKPLSDEEIDEILESLDVYIDTHAGVRLFARAIEAKVRGEK